MAAFLTPHIIIPKPTAKNTTPIRPKSIGKSHKSTRLEVMVPFARDAWEFRKIPAATSKNIAPIAVNTV